ncbi:serine hydrolase domain-containing protein [Longimicrobium sp.]|uniref:serine hydrolase domain-containing protein n=1 Tax=Longimicrobium sp. TaxID=2029185 RepID=UPI002CAC94F1|nr:serine hydrolase domain-containing protein [Longimicrobium sp.]HSU12992.1 serine hydrolase domain-containing protein [Longimicrobium sp.]
MQAFPTLLAGIAAALAASACMDLPTAAATGSCDPAYQSIARFVDSTAESHSAFGAALLLVRDGRVVCERYRGAFNETSELPAASASKWLTGVAILTLADAGKLSLGEPASARLPYLAGAAAAITPRQLLSHTSGLADGQACLFDAGSTLDACSRQIAATPPAYAPGTEFRYGGSSFTVAGRLAEVATGQSWNALFAERVAGPLGWRKTRWEGGNPVLAGGAITTVPEYGMLLRMLLAGGAWNGHQVLSAAALAELTRDNVGTAPMTETPRTGVHGYGLGVWRDAVDGAGRATQISSPGASGFYPWVDFGRNVAGIVVLPARDAADGYWYDATLQVQARLRQIVDSGH